MERPIFPFLWMRGEEESILRREIEKIAACGIRAICVEARPHDDFCGPGWWHDMDIVLDEAKRRDMCIWILDDKHFPTGYANGLIETKYPERKKQYLACTVADVFGSARPLTLNVQRMLKPSIGFWEIGDPVDYAERANNRLVALTALRFEEESRFHEDAIDLTATVDEQGFAHFTLPEGAWRVHAIYRTRTDGGNPSYINMLDAVSAHTQIEGVYEAHYAHYAGEFGKTIAGFFSDEPQFGNISDQVFDTKLGKKKMPLPWSDEMLYMLMNESASETFDGELSLPAACGQMRVSVELAPGESRLITETDETEPPRSGRIAGCEQSVDLSHHWTIALAPAADPPAFGEARAVETLTPVSDTEPTFSGLIRFEKTFMLDEKPEEAWFLPEQVFESLRLRVNGQDAGLCFAPPYALEIASFLKAGENTLTVEVATTPARDQLNMPQPPFDFSHEALEPTGMFGTVSLRYR